jgi:hypothetical protein
MLGFASHDSLCVVLPSWGFAACTPMAVSHGPGYDEIGAFRRAAWCGKLSGR